MLKSVDSKRLKLIKNLQEKREDFKKVYNLGCRSSAVMAPLSLEIARLEEILYPKQK